VRREWLARLEPPFLDVHAARWAEGNDVVVRDDARRFESWERSVANQLGLGRAVDDALALGLEAIAARVNALGASLRLQLASVPGLTLHDRGVERCGIVTFTIDGVDVYELAATLRSQAINISVSTIDFARYDFAARGLDAVARASVHYYNTEDELTRLVDAITARPRT
jgi:selenocysteine lyase/cysteine desulfurase